MTTYTIGIDVGGTFTDLVAIDAHGATSFAKSPSTPQDQSIGVLAGLDELARRLHLSRGEMLEQTQRIVHGATVATNALLERKGAKVALLTTAGHRDVLEMREGLKDNRYDLRSPPPRAAGAAQLAARRARTPARRRFGADAARRRIARCGDCNHQAVRRHVGRHLLPARLSQSRTRDRDRAAPARAHCRTCSSPVRATCCRRSRSTSASRPLS